MPGTSKVTFAHRQPAKASCYDAVASSRHDGAGLATFLARTNRDVVSDGSVKADLSLPRHAAEPNGEQPADLDDVDAARAREYSMLAALLARAPNAGLLKRIAKLSGDATPLGRAHAALALAANNSCVERIEREFFNLFIGIGRGELLPYGSYYLTGFLNERPLARLREDLRMLAIERAEGQAEPEDHAAFLCEVMAGLAGRCFSAPVEAQQEIFEKHLAPWFGRFLADLERAPAADFYRCVGTLGQLFMAIETEAFTLLA